MNVQLTNKKLRDRFSIFQMRHL